MFCRIFECWNACRKLTAIYLGLFILVSSAMSQEDSLTSALRKESDNLYTALNASNVDAVVAMFLEKGEMIDENGTVYQGHQALKELLTAYFAKFPGTKWEHDIESIRLVGPVAIEEGTRTTTTKDASTATIRYIAVHAKTPQGWRIASVRDFSEEPMPSPGEMLKPLAWLIGDWINEGADGRVKLSYRWSEDGNFILGDISVVGKENGTVKSSHRIGWDPLRGQPRSWMFDSDGGYAEGTWTSVEATWLVHSSAVMPDGQTGSAILKFFPGDKGRFTMSGTNRVVGGILENDFELTIVKQPPAAGNQ